MKKELVYAVVVLMLVLCCSEGFSYDVKAHKILAEKATRASILRGSLFFNELLGSHYAEGLDAPISYAGSTLTIEEWIQEGAQREDDPIGRTFNHFHDPNKAWDQALLTDFPLSPVVDYWYFLRGISVGNEPENCLPRWAQSLSQDPSTPYGQAELGGDWALYNFRLYLTRALEAIGAQGGTGSNAVIEANLAQAFMALGHLVHLVQDAAVPAHVRNDQHAIDGLGWGGLETWVDDTSSSQY